MAENVCDSPSEAKTIRIGTRESELALKQTHIVRDALQKTHPRLKFDIIKMKTHGDKILDVALSKIGSKSLFTKELEIALEKRHVDIVVHSLKDLPTTLPEGMVIGAVCEREDPRDVVIMHPKHAKASLAMLPKDSVVGTSSVRRAAQLKRNFPELMFESVRGNLNTRLRKLEEGSTYDALILAAAGVLRMGWQAKISQYLEEDLCMYAVGQGALAVECREEDSATLALLSSLGHRNTTVAAVAERGLMRTLEGGCSAPVAVHTKVTEDQLDLQGGVWSLDGSEELRHAMSTSLAEPDSSSDTSEHPAKVAKVSNTYSGVVSLQSLDHYMSQAHTLGVALAKHLLSKGADKMLAAAKQQNDANLPSNNPNLPPKTGGELKKEIEVNGS
ncbi:Porphobilinogen deaminase [Chionoecetes opilio]|uniref:hydroxymethylbilane synthase n=1 Tax=Chionoecetes opilio TaxID=41210 RepID=A0A8J4XPY3_CHIOP|nr:Porphobilinogen deaminase [Chionoecetes opilio]